MKYLVILLLLLMAVVLFGIGFSLRRGRIFSSGVIGGMMVAGLVIGCIALALQIFWP